MALLLFVETILLILFQRADFESEKYLIAHIYICKVKEQIIKIARKGLRPSQIGVIVRDSFYVAQVRWLAGNVILRILKDKRLAPSIPEALFQLYVYIYI